MEKSTFSDKDGTLIHKIIFWLRNIDPETFMLFYSGSAANSPPPHRHKLILGLTLSKTHIIDSLNDVDKNIKSGHLLGIISYDLKNQFENLTSENEDIFPFKNVFFFKPKIILEIDFNDEIRSNDQEFLSQLLTYKIPKTTFNLSTDNIFLKSNTTDNDYLENIKRIQGEIVDGNVYELNYCRNFSATGKLDPYIFFNSSITQNSTPFSCFFKHKDQFVVSNSMERFLYKNGDELVSQPIKGTIKNSGNNEFKEKDELLSSEKERAENLMIVDLVRNDLNRCSKNGTVKVEELFGIYSYKSVHQMISTIKSIANPDYKFSEIIESLFPMGSMTGAPKIAAMKIIERLETFKRGVFSGSMGYINPNGDFDFNVVIRTLFYDQSNGKINLPVGSAITIDSIAQNELEECNIKIEMLKELLNKASVIQ